MDTFQTLKELQNIHDNVQKITIGIADIYGNKELVINETDHSFQTISFGNLGGVSENHYPKPDFDFKKIPEDYRSLHHLMAYPFMLKEFYDSI